MSTRFGLHKDKEVGTAEWKWINESKEDRGVDFLIDNKRKMLEFFDNIEIRVTKKLRTNITQN